MGKKCYGTNTINNEGITNNINEVDAITYAMLKGQEQKDFACRLLREIFQEATDGEEEKTLLFFTSKLSISNTTSKKTDALSRLQKDQLLRLRPTGYSHVYMCSDGSVCQEIKREGQGVAHQPPPQQLTYVHQDFLPNFPSLEDESTRETLMQNLNEIVAQIEDALTPLEEYIRLTMQLKHMTKQKIKPEELFEQWKIFHMIM